MDVRCLLKDPEENDITLDILSDEHIIENNMRNDRKGELKDNSSTMEPFSTKKHSKW